jgi:hypothetical protein
MNVRTGMSSLRKCYDCLLLIQSTHIKRNTCKNKRVNFFPNKATARKRLTLRFAYLLPDCWLGVSLHPFATSQLDQGFLWFSSVLRANAKLVPKFHVALHASHAALPMATSEFRSNVTIPMLDQQPFQRHKILILIICVTSNRTTSGHCLGTFKTGMVSCPPPPQCSLSHYLPTFSLRAEHYETRPVLERLKQMANHWALSKRMTTVSRT